MVLWSYAMTSLAGPFPDDARVGERVTTGALVWELTHEDTSGDVGLNIQQADDGSFSFQYFAENDAREAAMPLSERILGMQAFTASGKWVVVAVEGELAQPPAAADAPQVDGPQTPAEILPNEGWPKDGEWITWQPMSWFHQDCDSSIQGTELHVWDLESRTVANTSFERPRAAALVIWDRPFPKYRYQCSGVFLRDNWVLTAAHCLVHNNTVPDEDHLTVSKPWAGTSVGVETFHINTTFSGNVDFDDDWALIKTTGSLGPEEMDLSSANDATLQQVGASFHNLGIPGWAPLCSPTNQTTLFHSTNNDITDFQNVRLRWRGDGTPGHSGGPIYYCPEGSSVSACAPGEKGFVVSVFAGWNSVYDRFVGPRVSEWRDEAITIMDTLQPDAFGLIG
jgi:hypothetical protein